MLRDRRYKRRYTRKPKPPFAGNKRPGRNNGNGDFLVAGRRVPRTGGIILARAKDRDTLEKITKQDPFIKHKLASADIIEFTASKTGIGL
ncbi:MAG: YciI family protein [Bacteroidota bacterium]